eukprot:1147121-Pelagomonas_calceolata.AAC.5
MTDLVGVRDGTFEVKYTDKCVQTFSAAVQFRLFEVQGDLEWVMDAAFGLERTSKLCTTFYCCAVLDI